MNSNHQQNKDHLRNHHHLRNHGLTRLLSKLLATLAFLALASISTDATMETADC
jgi:hypothetical protein